MIAVDTNIIVRLLVNDDAKQTKQVVQLFSNHLIAINVTILLETEWVLRFSYELAKPTISQLFKKLLGLANIRLAQPDKLYQAIQWYDQGMDFADALHLATAMPFSKFATFDKKFMQKAKLCTSIEFLEL